MKIANRGLFSEEANQEAKEKVNDPLHVFDTQGRNKREIGYESTQAYFGMTLPPNKDSKDVTTDIKQDILSMDKSNFTMKYILKHLKLGDFEKIENQNEFNDIVVLEKGDYPGIKKETETTVGRLLVNQILFSPLSIEYPYQNNAFGDGALDYNLNYIGSKVLSKDLPMEEYKALLKRVEDFGLRMSSVVAPSLDIDMIDLDDEIKEMRDELIEENREAIENGDTDVISGIEDKLLDEVKQKYKDNPQMELYLSGGKPYLDNSYKKNSIMIGAIPADLNGNKFHISTNNLVDGIDKSDIHKVSGAMILGAYFRGQKTQVGGYLAKQGIAMSQSIRAGKHGTDCGTNEYRTINVIENNKENYIDAYMVGSSGELSLLTYDNIDDYVGQEIDIRYPEGCVSEKICNKCMGERYYKLLDEYEDDIDVGLFISKILTELSQKSLQKTHSHRVA
jgi:hypothetical protein